MSNYQGHCADGSGIQKHSASEIYPHVITAKGDITWGVINGYTGETVWGYATAGEAGAAGAALKALHAAEIEARQAAYDCLQVVDGCDVSPQQSPGPVPSRFQGIGAYARWLLRAFGNYDNATLARMVRERFPDAKTNSLNIAWYRWQVRNA